MSAGAILVTGVGGLLGGGGYGDPLTRDPARVALDASEGYISAEACRQLYGVVLDNRGEPDGVATLALRKRLEASRFKLTAVADDNTFEPGAVSRRRIMRLNPADARAAGLEEDELVEIDFRVAASLRGWVRIDATVAPGTLPCDERCLAILKCAAGDKVEVRSVLSAVRPRVVIAAEAAE